MRHVKQRTLWLILLIIIAGYGLTNFGHSHEKIITTNEFKMSKLIVEDNGKLIYKNGIQNKKNKSNSYPDYGKLFISNMDGTEKRKLSNKVVSSIYVSGKAIYYSTQVDPGSTIYGFDIYLTNESGTYTKKICHTMSDQLQIMEGKIYYLEGALKSVNTDGTNRRTVYNSDRISIWQFIMDRNYLYFTGYNEDGIFKVSITGLGYTKICNQSASSLYEANGWLYFLDNYVNPPLHKVKLDGGKVYTVDDQERLTLEPYSYMKTEGKWNYFYKDNSIVIEGIKEKGVYKITKVNEVDSDEEFAVIGQYIYYIGQYDGCLYRMKNDGTVKVKM